MTPRHLTTSIALAGLLLAIAGQAGENSYPASRKVDQVDSYHGVDIADPYRWLENDVREDTNVGAWVEAQNEVTFAHLTALPGREALRERLTELWNYE